MTSDDDVGVSAPDRLTRARDERDKEIEMAQQRFWQRVVGEITSGQISQGEAARVLEVTRETLRQRTRQYSPGAPARPRSGSPVYLAVAVRLQGESNWRAASESADLLAVADAVLGGDSPYAGISLEFAYRQIEGVPTERRILYPIWTVAALNGRPMFLSEAVFDELYGPHDLKGTARREWEDRILSLRVQPGRGSFAG